MRRKRQPNGYVRIAIVSRGILSPRPIRLTPMMPSAGAPTAFQSIRSFRLAKSLGAITKRVRAPHIGLGLDMFGHAENTLTPPTKDKQKPIHKPRVLLYNEDCRCW